MVSFDQRRETCWQQISTLQSLRIFLANELRCNQLPEAQSALVHVSKFGVIPKKHQPGKWRLIVDLLSPDGVNVNDFIDPTLYSASVEDAAVFVFKAGCEAILATRWISKQRTASGRSALVGHAMV